jgi:hypothetical protein
MPFYCADLGYIISQFISLLFRIFIPLKKGVNFPQPESNIKIFNIIGLFPDKGLLIWPRATGIAGWGTLF